MIMRSARILCLLLSLPIVVPAQLPEAAPTTLTVRSTLVLAPVLVKTRKGDVVFKLTAEDFLLTDNGAPQNLTLVEDTDSQPLAPDSGVET